MNKEYRVYGFQTRYIVNSSEYVSSKLYLACFVKINVEICSYLMMNKTGFSSNCNVSL